MTTPFFSIIVPFYGETAGEESFKRCLRSLLLQTCKDFEILIYHDGPKGRELSEGEEGAISLLRTYAKGGLKFTYTEERVGDWGHSLRDRGLSEARGKYIVHLNSDNKLYDSLGAVKNCIENTNYKPLYTFGAVMIGIKIKEVLWKKTTIVNTGKPEDHITLRGIPKPGSIDALQVVASLEAWKSIGGWHDKTMNSDGELALKLALKYDYVNNSSIIIGEHW